jgi:hypothetical protein
MFREDGFIRLKRAAVLLILLTGGRTGWAIDSDYYLPSDTKYDPALPAPKSYLGFEIGERHLLHHELVGYLHELAEASDRVTIREYARSYGNRPLVLLTITAPANHARIDELSDLHRQLADPAVSDDVDIDALPAVINMGYAVHGNEPSAGNVAPLVAYHLAAAQGSDIEALLEQVVVLLDPCLNPDGFDRFAHWANNHRGRVFNPDNDHREHQENWPSGRTNYYWFDLNRDWLPAQHPASQGRLQIARQWRPNVVLDFHEMGGNETFFFQPGVPKRTNPLTPQRNIDLTNRIADFHASALDSIRALYYTQEKFDDFYMGKGSTYPDLHGGVGILFEQASSRGHVTETDNGELTFPFTIRNQFKTSLSSLDAVRTLRTDLLDYKRTFYQDALTLARSSPVTGYVVAAPGDPARLREFLEILDRHGIAFAPLAANITHDGFEYRAERDYFIPTAQPEYRFLVDLFARRTTFVENIFYDVSAWTLPLAFNLQYAELTEPPGAKGKMQNWEGEWAPSGYAEPRPPRFPQNADSAGASPSQSDTGCFPAACFPAATPPPEFSPQDVAYVIDWRGRYAPRMLYRLLDAEVRVKAAQRPFQVARDGETFDFSYGTLLVPLSLQEEKQAAIQTLLAQAAEDETKVVPLRTSLTEGVDLGSSQFAPLKKPVVLLIVGDGVSTSEAGEVWHLLDQRYQMPLTLVDAHRLGSVRLADYNTIVMVSGSYGPVSDGAVARLKHWLSDGGTLIAIGTAIPWLSRKEVAKIALRSGDDAGESDDADDESDDDESDDAPARIPYADAADTAAFRLIKGAIFQTQLDLTHPVAYGYTRELLPVFRNNSVILNPSKNPFATPALYSDSPLLSGYVSAENLARLKRSASVVIHKTGGGRIVAMAENPNFRAFWHGTNRLFLNAIFFGSVIRVPSM